MTLFVQNHELRKWKKNQVKAKANINIYKTEIMKKQQNMKGITILYLMVKQSSGSLQSVIIVIYCAAFETKRGFSLVWGGIVFKNQVPSLDV